MLNKQMILAVVIHVIITIIYIFDPEYSFIAYISGAIVLFNIIGIVMIQLGNKTAGARIFMISSALLVPIGLIGAMGARKIIDEEKRKDFYNSTNQTNDN